MNKFYTLNPCLSWFMTVNIFKFVFKEQTIPVDRKNCEKNGDAHNFRNLYSISGGKI